MVPAVALEMEKARMANRRIKKYIIIPSTCHGMLHVAFPPLVGHVALTCPLMCLHPQSPTTQHFHVPYFLNIILNQNRFRSN